MTIKELATMFHLSPKIKMSSYVAERSNKFRRCSVWSESGTHVLKYLDVTDGEEAGRLAR